MASDDPTQETSGTAPEGPRPLELALDFIEDYAVFLVDPQGRIASWNVGAERLKGYRPEEAIGQPFALLFTEEDAAAGRPEKEMQYAAEHGVYQGEGQRRRKDGSTFSAEVTLRAIREGDRPLRGFVKVTRDVTARKTAEAAARARAEFEEELMGIVSHDLRSPLAAVLLGVTRLEQLGALQGPERGVLARVRAAAERCTRMVHELLDFTQVRLGPGLAVRPSPMDVALLVEDAVQEVRGFHPEREVRVEVEGDTRGAWDADRLGQLLGNLLNNAMDYGDPDRPVTVTVRGGEADVELGVHSWGEPIPDSLLPVLFERLTRGADREAGQRGSVGLGLFIVSHIARAHGGSVTVESARTHGTRFRVRLPRAPGAAGGLTGPAGLTPPAG
jgi:PAS domain S-box-containing protein